MTVRSPLRATVPEHDFAESVSPAPLWGYSANPAMTDTVTVALISGGVGLVVGLVPFIYRVRRDREEREERRREAARVAKIEAERRNAEARQARTRNVRI